MKSTQQYLWTLIRIRIIFEITRYYAWKCKLIEKQECSEKEKDDRKSKDGLVISETVAFYKNLPIPDADLEKFGVKNGSASHYLFDSISADLIGKHLFNHLSAAAHFGHYKNNEEGITLYSGGQTILTITKDGTTEFSANDRACEFVLFLNNLFESAEIPSEEQFQIMDIRPTLDAIATPVVVK